ncbi:glycosyltransferase family 4 protein [Pseudaquabacterium pictum]|uniref:Glycosyltransferase WbuB n=1 Tax=Pseudaquabacterium pictum TaxID=2315236 RepID=A0A480APJ7_9BURK|nr:glycosyltransferase family 4 protein [Rubrivivax pictus]GCL63474.1 glycosyltransferase WbuB [Rubrivivax pictus]
MNILYLNHYAGSPALGMEYRPYYLAREWVRAGHRVQVVAADFSHVRARQPQAGDQTIDGIAYRWLPTPPYQGNGLGRVKNIWAFCRQVWAMADRLVAEFQPDAVIASSTYPMDIWVARRIARKARARLVFEVHDLWPLSPIELSGMSPRHPFIRLVQKAEDDAYRDADVVVSMLPKVHSYMASRGLDLAKLTIVPNGITLDEWQGTPAPLRDDVARAIAERRAAGHTVVGYAGSMGLPNALDHLLDAAKALQGDRLAIVMVGDGHERARLAQRVADEGLPNVTMLPPIPKAQIPSLLAAIDIAFIGWQRVPIYRFGIAPNKLMDYMMAGCAVLHSVEAGNDPVAESGCGLTVAPESATAIADGLRRLAALPAAERQAMGERGRAFVLAYHTYPVLAQCFIQAMQR